ncbi:peptidylprolyl isomerase [Porphyromonas sp.]|uniref:peptidylprolyl isomerase n=1 Tax=Porphyromonas sp. TaxID=1924944 RepID=UPI0026DD5423|nr:peptidylprolyl isomerase [Porphyromonas sp.]MDO4770716.1 peptidylprolyl isomerase [Porphyromonas sp.]
MLRKIFPVFAILLFTSLSLLAQQPKVKEVMVEFKTNKGVFVVKLYNETPKHRDNFLKLIANKSYDNIIFHRIINGFMIQAGGNVLNGDEETKKELEERYKETIEAEFMYPTLFHKQGALAAARVGDGENPEKKSSSFQFYIVTGKFFLDHELDKTFVKKGLPLPKEIKDIYLSKGGAPHLDGEYTVFGEIVKGDKVIDKIQHVDTNDEDQPIKPVYIKSAKIIEK